VKLSPKRFYALSIALAGISLTACGGGGDSAESTTSVAPTTVAVTEAPTTVAETTTTTIPVPVMPLNGLPIVDEAAAIRPAIVVKIDNHPGARPQTGLNEADIVYEENVEKWTRFAAVFHSTGSDPVGPVRSGRTQDINLVTSLNHPLFVWSGGNPTVTGLIQKSELINMSASAASKGGGFFRSTDKKAPHNLFTNTTNIWALDAGRGGTPPPQFSYRTEGSALGAPIAGLKLTMDGNMKTAWQWDPTLEKFVRFHDAKAHVDSNGVQINMDNVVVIVCEYKFSSADKNSPEAQTVGTGAAWLFTQGTWTEGTWNRPDNKSAWVLTDASGAPMLLTPGRTWVELARDKQAVAVAAGSSVADTPWP
jgi:hypothetical protein